MIVYEVMLPKDILFFIIYGAVAMMALSAAGYLLLRRGNAFSPHITSPLRLRLWTATFFAFAGLGHFYYLPTAFHTSSEVIKLSLYVGATLDFLTFFPLAIIVMLVMLQDRRRPLWPVGVAMVPPALAVVWCLYSDSDAILPFIYAYLAILGIVITIYMLYALRLYSRWLRDNYADLEHKEVWQTFAVMAGILFMLGFYIFGDKGLVYEYIVQFGGGMLICYLLWRVENLSDLGNLQAQSTEVSGVNRPHNNLSSSRLEVDTNDFDRLLQEHCIDTQLYLRHDLSATDLAAAIGTNRTYLAQYFSRCGVNYNAYINDLRISHFVNLYHDVVATGRIVTLQQLTQDCGYRSYSTFSLAFKQRMGMTVTAWTRSLTHTT